MHIRLNVIFLITIASEDSGELKFKKKNANYIKCYQVRASHFERSNTHLKIATMQRRGECGISKVSHDSERNEIMCKYSFMDYNAKNKKKSVGAWSCALTYL